MEKLIRISSFPYLCPKCNGDKTSYDYLAGMQIQIRCDLCKGLGAVNKKDGLKFLNSVELEKKKIEKTNKKSQKEKLRDEYGDLLRKITWLEIHRAILKTEIKSVGLSWHEGTWANIWAKKKELEEKFEKYEKKKEGK